MNEVISIICAEKSWKGVMLEQSSIDGFAMVAESQTNSTQILLEKLGILMGWRISTVKNFCVPIVRSPNTPKRSGNFMENLRTWIGMGEIKHDSNTVKQIWQIVEEALKKKLVPTEKKNLEN